ncbi:aminotransferase class I/II-fold pyridoxal phosphate-dependent enzyme [Streptomyces peucetius]|nr:hypothetical protein CGZ69_35540 [Streptomyces peucetius subsp. caesius ATCC 27952]
MSDPTGNLATDLSTASVSDALDSLGLPGSLHGIGALRQGQRVVGPVFTVTYESVDETGGTVGDFLDDVPAGAVVLIDNAGRTDCTVWGGIMSRTSPGAGRPPQIALAALGDTSTTVEAASDYRRRRALLVEALNGIAGIDCPLPDGGMFAFPDVSGLLRDRGWSSSADLATWLLDTAHLAVVPGEAFNAPGRIRVCFAVDDDTLITAIERLRTALGPAAHESAVRQMEEAR